jgi:uncharacterized protein YoxC
MDKQKQVLVKLEILKDDYNRKKRELDETMTAVEQEKWRFKRELEDLSEQMRYIFHKREYNDSNGLQQAYRMISATQEESEWAIKKVVKKLDDEQEEQQAVYKQQVLSYEEELHQLKKESGT